MLGNLKVYLNPLTILTDLNIFGSVKELKVSYCPCVCREVRQNSHIKICPYTYVDIYRQQHRSRQKSFHIYYYFGLKEQPYFCLYSKQRRNDGEVGKSERLETIYKYFFPIFSIYFLLLLNTNKATFGSQPTSHQHKHSKMMLKGEQK